MTILGMVGDPPGDGGLDLGDASNSLHRKVDYWGSYRKVLEKSLLDYLSREKVLKKLKVNCFSLKKSLKTLMFNYFPEKQSLE